MQKDATILLQGERASVVKHEDNLKMEGAFEGRSKAEAFTRGDRVDVVRHKDNLTMEQNRLKSQRLTFYEVEFENSRK